jgi:hypothetical protein
MASGRELRSATFRRLVGSKFTLRAEGRTRTITLLSVKQHATARPGTGECFSLFFTAPRPVAASGLHTLEHPDLGRFTMALSPVGQPSEGQHYEAVVNRF